MSNQVLSSWKVMRRHSSSRNLRLLGMRSVKDSSSMVVSFAVDTEVTDLTSANLSSRRLE